jgi:hypothetical protein
MTNATAKTDRYSNRAPKGGAISPVNGQFYAGGQFMPMAADVVEVKPATLEGSTRQVAWANRLRREELARLDEELTVRRLMLADTKVIDEAAVRRAIRRDSIARYRLMAERSASAVIDRRMVGTA